MRVTRPVDSGQANLGMASHVQRPFRHIAGDSSFAPNRVYGNSSPTRYAEALV